MAKYETVDRGPSAAAKPYQARDVENGEVDEPSCALREMLPDIQLISTLLGGSRAMREASREHLPQHQYETDAAYGNRLQATVLDNFTLRTLNKLVGKAFKEAPQPAPEAPAQIVDFLDDVDDAGTGLVPFAREWFRAGVREAVAHVLVDMPAPAPRADGTARTLADDVRDGLRPFWRLISACDMLDYQVGRVTIMGRSVVAPTLIRFRDDAVQPDGAFGVRLVQRRKVLRHSDAGVTWEVWELQQGPRKGKPKWVLVQPPAPYGLPLIPVATFYTDKTGPGEGRPPFVSTLFQTGVSLAIVWTHSLRHALDSVGALLVLFSALTCCSLFAMRLRRDLPNPRPVALVCAVAYVALSGWVLFYGIKHRISISLLVLVGAVLVAASIAYLVTERLRRRAGASSGRGAESTSRS